MVNRRPNEQTKNVFKGFRTHPKEARHEERNMEKAQTVKSLRRIFVRGKNRLVFEQPVSDIDDPNAFVLIFIVPCPG